MLVPVGDHTETRHKGRVVRPRAARLNGINRFSKGCAARLTTRRIAFAVLGAIGAQPCAVQAQSTLPIVSDHIPIGTTSNGLPLPYIAKPNAAGVSHSRFTHYNVGTLGVVLGNSGIPTLTQQGGWAGGNPFLGNGHARVILIEVPSGNPSRLLGMKEVAGYAANVVIANPAGIHCDGCGFINAPRATLVTGVPILNGLGALSGLAVMQGALTVDGKGLDARGSSQVDLIARAMRINGQIWGRQRVTAVAGVNHVDYTAGDVSPIKGGGTGAPPVVAIDVAALGGMYANAVRLVSTEHGVGVNLEGIVNSLTGDLHVSSTGDVTVARSGELLAAQNARLDAGNLVNDGGKLLGNLVMAKATGTLSNVGGRIEGAYATRLDATEVVNTNEGVIGGRSVAIDVAGALENDGGAIVADEVLTAKVSGAMSNQEGLIKSHGSASLAAQGELDNRTGYVIASDNLEVHAQDIRNDDGTINAVRGTLEVVADHTLTNEGGKMLGESVTARAGDSLVNIDGYIESSELTQIETKTLVNEEGEIIGTKVRIDAADALRNAEGKVFAEKALDVNAGTVSNFEGQITSSGTATITATGELNNREGVITSGDKITIHSGRLDNDAGRITAQNFADIRVDGELTNRDGTLGANDNVDVSAKSVTNNDGLMHAGGIRSDVESQRR
jgi:filamentous hemagglutinin